MCLWLYSQIGFAENRSSTPKKPVLVVGIVVDQMRYDFLYRYADCYSKGGFQRMLREGFSFSSCLYSYAPTYTGPGHASIYTGTTPGLHGIVGNTWFEASAKRRYCAQDDSVTGIGTDGIEGKMSPANMLAGSIADQFKIAGNFQGKTFGIGLKDRGAIFPAGHGANAAFWFDFEKGNFVSSSWYKGLNGKLPSWLQKFNNSGLLASYLDSVWKPLLPLQRYKASTEDDKIWENPLVPNRAPVFPYRLKDLNTPDAVAASPFGNSLTNQLAMALINGEQLGKDSITDFLAVSFSSTDIIGHSYGPFAIETQDAYIRLDRELEKLFSFLDEKLGKDSYLCFLSADHGIMEIPAFLRDKQIPANNFSSNKTLDSLRSISIRLAGQDWLAGMDNLQVYFRDGFFSLEESKQKSIELAFIKWLEKQPGILRAFRLYGEKPWPEPPFLEKFKSSYYPGRSGQLQILLKPGVLNQGSAKGTTHGAPYPYDSHVPCLWMGWKIQQGEDVQPFAIEDLAPTLSGLMHIGFPNACTGKAHSIPLKP